MTLRDFAKSTSLLILVLSVHLLQCSGEENVAVLNDGDLLGKYIGELGPIEDDTTVSNPQVISNLQPVRDICTGGYSTTIIDKATGKVFQFGLAGKTELGGALHEVVFPESVEITSLACGDYFTLALSEDGEVWSWGKESSFLGHPDTSTDTSSELHLTPRKIETFGNKKITFIDAGYEHSIALTEQGRAYGWGSGKFGQTGVKLGSDNKIPHLIQSPKTQAKRFVGGCAGGTHSLLVTDKGELYSFGNGAFGKLGITSQTADSSVPLLVESLKNVRITKVSCGGDHSLALSSDGKVYSWGWNEMGQLGTGDTENREVPHEISFLSDKNIVEIISGKYGHSLALSNNGTLYVFGWNEQGQLGTGDTDNRISVVQLNGLPPLRKVQAGYKHTVGLTEDGKVIAFGENVFGQLGVLESLQTDEVVKEKVKENSNKEKETDTENKETPKLTRRQRKIIEELQRQQQEGPTLALGSGSIETPEHDGMKAMRNDKDEHIKIRE